MGSAAGRNKPRDIDHIWKQITDFKTDQIFWFDWSRDGKLLALARGSVTSDVVLIKDSK